MSPLLSCCVIWNSKLGRCDSNLQIWNSQSLTDPLKCITTSLLMISPPHSCYWSNPRHIRWHWLLRLLFCSNLISWFPYLSDILAAHRADPALFKYQEYSCVCLRFAPYLLHAWWLWWFWRSSHASLFCMIWMIITITCVLSWPHLWMIDSVCSSY